jgi:putative PIN family toxin of toxin-antitoxin system
MRVVLDTNVLISALISPSGSAHLVYKAWQSGDFRLVSCEEQIAEMRRVTRRPAIRDWIKPAEAGRLINQIRHLAIMIDPVPQVSASPDPADDYLLAMAVSGHADYLVTGDKSDLLALERFKRTRIVTIRRFLLARS